MEKEIWEGRPSQWINIKSFIFYGLLSSLIIPILIILWKILVVKCWHIRITDQRLIEEKGVLSKRTDELEFYRVKDIRLEQPLLLRMVSLSNIILITSDKSNSVIKIPAVPNGKQLREELRVVVEKRRDIKGVREYDM